MGPGYDCPSVRSTIEWEKRVYKRERERERKSQRRERQKKRERECLKRLWAKTRSLTNKKHMNITLKNGINHLKMTTL